MPRIRWFIISFCLLCSCAISSPPRSMPAQPVHLTDSQLYIIPFETVMVPQEVSAHLLDLFVDQLNQQGAQRDLEFIILKQDLAEIDPGWLASRSYLKGELFAYIEDVGSSMTDIKARSRIRLFLPGQATASLQLDFPHEIFFQNDYSTLPVERHKLAEQIARTFAQRFWAAIAVSE